MSAMVTGTVSFVGANGEFASTPLSANPTDSFAHSPYDGLKGQLLEGGLANAVVTAVELSIDNGLTPEFVLFNQGAAAVTEGRCNITGTVSAMFENTAMLNKFLNETESSLTITFGDGISESYTVTLPRIKYTGGNKPVDGEGSIVLSMPFQALLDPVTGTNIRIDRM